MVWGIASQDQAQDVREFVDRFGLTFPILLDPDGTVNQRYAQEMAFPSSAYPQDWVIGTDGAIAYGSNSFELDAMVTAIEDELRGSDDLDTTDDTDDTPVDSADAPDLTGAWAGACSPRTDGVLSLEATLTEQDGFSASGRGILRFQPSDIPETLTDTADVSVEITPFTEAIAIRFDVDGDDYGDIYVRLVGTLDDPDTITGTCTQGTASSTFRLER